MLKLAGDSAEQFLTKLFNAVFDEGVYPEEWSKAIIIPIFKKGNKNNTDNYRGISLIIIISPLTVRVVGAPRVISQPVSSIFPCSPLPSGTCRTAGLCIP